MNLKSIVERPLYLLPWLHAAVLQRRPVPDLNKLSWIRVVERGQVVLDVGANRGHYTTFFSRKVGSNGKVYAFEPIPETADALRLQCAGLRNVRIAQVALSDEVRMGAEMLIPGRDLQQASLKSHASGSWRTCEEVFRREVEVTTLDSWSARENPGKIDFIKLDVEGAEYAVLRGGEATIGQFRPLIYLEICRAWLQGFGIDLSDVARELAHLGYTRTYRPVIARGRFSLLPADLLECEDGDVLASCRPI